jgi:hypothetical protein
VLVTWNYEGGRGCLDFLDTMHEWIDELEGLNGGAQLMPWMAMRKVEAVCLLHPQGTNGCFWLNEQDANAFFGHFGEERWEQVGENAWRFEE